MKKMTSMQVKFSHGHTSVYRCTVEQAQEAIIALNMGANVIYLGCNEINTRNQQGQTTIQELKILP